MAFRSGLLVLLALVIAGVHSAPGTCTYQFPSGSNYQLGPLSALLASQDMSCGPDANNQMYLVNVCRTTVKACGSSLSPVCQSIGGGTTLNGCGVLVGPGGSPNAWTEFTNKSGFVATYSGGANGRSSTISFSCDCTVQNSCGWKPVEAPKLDYHINIISKYACPVGKCGGGTSGGGTKGGSTSGGSTSGGSTSGSTTSTTSTKGKKHHKGSDFDYGWIFVIIVCSFFFLYVTIGFAVNRFYLKYQGLEQLPNWAFWAGFPGLIWDGFLFVYRSIRGLCGHSHSHL